MKKNLEPDVQTDLIVENLSVSFYGHSILEKVSFKIEKGKLAVLLGPNGAGKTSLIRAITGLIKPDEGEIHIGGIPLKRMKRKQQARYLSYVPQHHQAVYNYSVQDFVLMGRTPYLGIFGTPGAKDRKMVDEVLEYLGIQSLGKRNYLSLSAGERQMVLLARSMAQNARVMMMDEPTTYLDYQKQYNFLESLKKMVETRGMTSVISLHDPNLALKFADKIIMIHHKKILAEVDCKGTDYISEFEKYIKVMYGWQVKIKKCENDSVVFWEQANSC